MGKLFGSKCSFLLSVLLVLLLVFPLSNAFATINDNVLPPSNLAFQMLAPDDVKLTWSPVYGATGYYVYEITEGQLIQHGSSTSTAYTLNNLPEGSYSYVVSTLSPDGESGPCAPITVDIVYPDMAAPATLTYTIKNGNEIALSWGASQYAQTYNLYEITEDGQETLVTSITGRTYTVNDAPAGSHQYAVSSVNSLYGESPLSTPVQVEVVFPTMTAPGNFTFTLTNGNDINLKWGAVAYATGYKVYQVIDGQKVLQSTVTGTAVTYNNHPAGDYVYEVHSYSDRFGESADGSQVSLTVGAITMVAPGNFTYKVQNVNDIVLTWGTVSNATAYKVYQIIDGQKVLKSTVTGTTATYNNHPAGEYIYEVHSFSDRFGESADGSQVSFTLGTVTMEAPGNFMYSVQNGNDIVLTWGTVSNATSYKVYQIIEEQKVLKSTVTGTTVTYTNQSDGDYVYEVYSYSDRFGESANGSQVSFTLGTVTMEAPGNFTYNLQNVNDIVLTWGTVSNATSYKVYQIINGQKVLKSTVTGTTAKYSNMPAGDYNYEVHSFSTRFGESQEGSSLSFTLVFPTMQPPDNLIQTIKSATSFTLSWDTSEYATSYKVYQVVNGQKVLKSTVAGTTVTYTNIPPGEYTYEVHSYSTRFGESLEGSQLTVTMNGQMMEAPTNLTYSLANGNDISLKWTAAPYATSYKVYQVIDGQEVFKSTTTGTTVKYTNSPAGDYHYAVHSVSTLLGESPSGAEVTFSLVFPVMAAPGNLAYRIQNGNDVVLTWGAVQYATGYKVYELVDGQEVLKTSVANLTATLSKVSAGDHTFVVHSVSTRFGESQEGSQVSLTLEQQTMLAPGNFTYSITNGNDINLKWDTVTYATAYKVYQISEGQKVLKSTVTGTSVKYTNMPAGDYVFEVHSYSDRFGESLDGSQVSFTLVFPAMQEPANLTQSITNGNDITLKWTAATYATNYKIYQIIDGQKVLKSTVTATSVKYTNMPAGDYVYEVHSFSSRFGESTLGSEINFTLVWPVVQPPLLKWTIYNVNNITLTWQAAEWANEYRVYEVTGNSRQLVYKGTALTYKLYNLSEGTHNYEMTTYNTRFGESAPSNRLTETIIYPIMQPPVASLKLLSPTSAQILWNFVTYANGYNVYEIIDGNPVLLTENLNNLSYTVSNLSYRDHQYYVTSFSNSFGQSDPSNMVIAKLIVDTVPPVTTADAPTDWTNQSCVVALSATDNLTGVADTYYSVNDSAFEAGTSFTLNQEGVNKISFYSVDQVGNIEETQTIEVKIDQTVPVTAANVPATWSGEDVTVNLTATDKLSGVAKTFYSINGSDYVEGATFTVDKEGVSKVSFYSVDAAGNTEAVNTAEVKVDKTAPVITINLNDQYDLGTTLQLQYSAKDSLSGLVSEKMTVLGPDTATGNELANGTTIQLDKPGVYSVIITATDAAGLSTTVRKQFEVIIPTIPATIEVTPKVMKGNKGVFTVRVVLPEGYSTDGFDLDTATLNGVKALTSSNGYYEQAKIGQFKFERADFIWTPSDVKVEFRCYLKGYLVVGQTTVKVQK